MQHPDAELKVYVVWLPMLGPDARSEIDTGLIDGARVTHFWDEERVLGRWLADNRIGGASEGEIVWDAYYVFGPDAEWNERPGPVAGFGAPVISNSDSLERDLQPFLGTG